MKAGFFPARAVGYDIGNSKEKGTPCVVVRFQIVNHPDFAGEFIIWRGYFTEKTAERTIESLRYAGWKGTNLKGDLMEEGLGSQLVSLDIRSSEYKGKRRLECAWVNRFNDGTVRLGSAAMSDDERETFAAEFMALCESVAPVDGPPADDAVAMPRAGLSVDAPSAPPPPPPPPPRQDYSSDEPPPLVDDDIPF